MEGRNKREHTVRGNIQQCADLVLVNQLVKFTCRQAYDLSLWIKTGCKSCHFNTSVPMGKRGGIERKNISALIFTH